jgi:hypothetical protein
MKTLKLTLLLSSITLATYAQNVGISNTSATPDSSAMLDIASITKGLLIPRVQLTATNVAAPLVAPANSLLVFNLLPAGAFPTNVKKGYYYWDAALSLWVGIGANNAWELLGNANTTAGTNFIGTTDNVSLRFRTNNAQKVIIDSIGNVGIGISAPRYKLHTDGGLVGASQQSNNGGFISEVYTNPFNESSIFIGYRTRGTVLSPTHVLSGDILSIFQGRSGLNFSQGSGMDIRATENQNATSAGARITFGTIPNATLIPLERMTIQQDGNVGINTTTPTEKLEVAGKALLTNGFSPTNAALLYKNTTDYLYLGPQSGSSVNGATLNIYGATNNESFSPNPGGIDFNTIGGISRILDNGNFGIGTAAPSHKLEVFESAGGANTVVSRFRTNTVNAGISLQDINTTAAPAIFSQTNDLSLWTNAASRIWITAAGNVGIGTGFGNPTEKLHVIGNTYVAGKTISERAGASNPMFEARKTDAGAGSMMSFVTNGSITGEIATTGVATTYNTTSDIRLKENIKETHFTISDINKIEVKEYNYKADKNKQSQTGFIAQQLYTIYPEAVTKGGDDANAQPWMIDYSKLTPLLIKGMQDQQKTIELLLKRIEALEKK